MNYRGKIKAGIEKRLISLHISPRECDLGILDTIIDSVTDEILLICAIETLPDELLESVADISAADYAEASLLGDGGAKGAVTSKSDGDLSLKYASGTTELERKLSACGKMRCRGLDRAKKYRRIRW